jgi:hypothetical protein
MIQRRKAAWFTSRFLSGKPRLFDDLTCSSTAMG